MISPKSSISSHVRISYRFYQFVTTRYATDFYIIKKFSKIYIDYYMLRAWYRFYSRVFNTISRTSESSSISISIKKLRALGHKSLNILTTKTALSLASRNWPITSRVQTERYYNVNNTHGQLINSHGPVGLFNCRVHLPCDWKGRKNIEIVQKLGFVRSLYLSGFLWLLWVRRKFRQETKNGYEHMTIKCITIRPDIILRILNQKL